jgi:hypothetical protein
MFSETGCGDYLHGRVIRKPCHFLGEAVVCGSRYIISPWQSEAVGSNAWSSARFSPLSFAESGPKLGSVRFETPAYYPRLKHRISRAAANGKRWFLKWILVNSERQPARNQKNSSTDRNLSST